jgi:hypothetical protein
MALCDSGDASAKLQSAKKMHNLEESATWEDLVKTARQRALRRVERLDTLVAAVVLLLLLFGWAVSFAPVGLWPGSHLLTAARSPHA